VDSQNLARGEPLQTDLDAWQASPTSHRNDQPAPQALSGAVRRSSAIGRAPLGDTPQAGLLGRKDLVQSGLNTWRETRLRDAVCRGERARIPKRIALSSEVWRISLLVRLRV
jgi:hypothetical protein